MKAKQFEKNIDKKLENTARYVARMCNFSADGKITESDVYDRALEEILELATEYQETQDAIELLNSLGAMNETEYNKLSDVVIVYMLVVNELKEETKENDITRLVHFSQSEPRQRAIEKAKKDYGC